MGGVRTSLFFAFVLGQNIFNMENRIAFPKRKWGGKYFFTGYLELNKVYFYIKIPKKL